ncbi:hypothetical protein WISP_102642 [Willisornis vidua]|uniref:Uncharacterized protein n=1 Tax=Willisornis vidua TaxID=1566151 RepID=A0ABQ9D3X1_9PASS|nr:hypothetical protein WISP_102642 [Willisornis vidua]
MAVVWSRVVVVVWSRVVVSSCRDSGPPPNPMSGLEVFKPPYYVPSGAGSDRTRGNTFKIKEGREYNEALEQVAHSCGCPIPGSVQGQVGWGSEQPGLVEGVPAHSRVLKLDDLPGPFQPKPFNFDDDEDVDETASGVMLQKKGDSNVITSASSLPAFKKHLDNTLRHMV